MNSAQIDQIVEEVRHIPLDALNRLFESNPKFKELSEQAVSRIRMQVEQLWKPDTRSIDLRYKIEELKIDRVERDGITHFLDIASLNRFDREMRQYKGIYTVGVYTAVKKFFDTNKQKLLIQQQLLERDVHIVQFGNFAERSEERMNLAIGASMFVLPVQDVDNDFKPDSDELGKPVDIVTSNISHTGLKIRCKQMFEKGTLVGIRFDDLEKDLVFKQKIVTYRILMQRFNEKYKMFEYALALETIEANEEFKSYTKNLIYSHKHKYKVDLEYIYDTCLSKGFEQYFIDRSDTLNLFVDGQSKINHIFCNHKNEELLNNFTIAGKNHLQELLNKDRILETLLQRGEVFYFVTRVKTNQSGALALLSSVVDDRESSLSLLQKYAGGQASSLYSVSVHEIDEKQATKRSTIPTEAQNAYGSSRVHRFSSHAIEAIAKSQYLITLTPILESFCERIKWSDQVYQPNAQQLLRPDSNTKATIPVVLAEQDDNRCEDRFLFNSPATIRFKSQEFKGKITNISSLGLCIAGNAGSHLSKGDLVSVCFDEFVERTTLYSLGRCDYRVVYADRHSLRLSNERFSDHDGRAFLQRYITAKLDDLQQLDRENEVYGLNRLLRNLSSTYTPNYHFFIRTFRQKPALAGVSVPDRRAAEIYSKNRRTDFINNVKGWFYNDDITELVNQQLHPSKKDSAGHTAIAVLSYRVSKENAILTKVWMLTDDNLNHDSLQNAMRIATVNGRTVRVFELRCCRTAKEFNRYYLDELSYIKKFAPHKYKSLRDEIERIKAMFEAVEITPLLEQVMPKD